MANQPCSNRTRHVLHYIVAIVALFFALAGPGGALGQAKPGTSEVKIGIIGSGNMGSTLGTLW